MRKKTAKLAVANSSADLVVEANPDPKPLHVDGYFASNHDRYPPGSFCLWLADQMDAGMGWRARVVIPRGLTLYLAHVICTTGDRRYIASRSHLASANCDPDQIIAGLQDFDTAIAKVPLDLVRAAVELLLAAGELLP
jgi:hypothetical protein